MNFDSAANKLKKRFVYRNQNTMLTKKQVNRTKS